MNLSQCNILITGGSDGIGKSLAEKFIAAGSRVIVTGRNEEKLEQAKKEIPGLEIIVNDIGDADQREILVEYIQSNMPGINILINNAGIQRRVSLASDTADWAERQSEINILLSAPIHLNHLLIPIILTHGNPSLIINVTSGGAYIPQIFAPVYSACKAALHNYTITLRKALENTNCRVIELVPPAVQTSLSGSDHGVSLNVFTGFVFKKLTTENVQEIGFGPTENLQLKIGEKSLRELFEASAKRFPVQSYSDDRSW